MRARWMAVALMVAQLLSPRTAWGDARTDSLIALAQRDYAAALPFIRTAAEQGDASFQTQLGLMYRVGQGVPKDYREALKWYHLAAAQGDPGAQHEIGTMYSEGWGVLRNRREAARWIRMAALQGYELSMYELGKRYINGDGVPQNYVRGHMWSNLTAGVGDMIANFAATMRDSVASKMTADQIAEAQRLAQECLSSNYKRCGEPSN